MRESQSKKVEKYRNASAENAAKNLGSRFFFEQLFSFGRKIIVKDAGNKNKGPIYFNP